MVNYLSFISTVIDFAVKMDMLSDDLAGTYQFLKARKRKNRYIPLRRSLVFLNF